MKIKNSPVHSFGGYELDPTAISTARSTNKRSIILPYSGQLPDELSDATSAAISISPQPDLGFKLILLVDVDGKTTRYPVEATHDELDRLLWPFFFVDHLNSDGGGRSDTRFDNGLTRYWLGHYQSTYGSWRRLTRSVYHLHGLLQQLPDSKLRQLLKWLQEEQPT